MAKRNYKKEYAQYHSKPEARAKRAELNRYNRKRGTYGNGDGLDASHRGGIIVGFESPKTNRSRNGKGSTRRRKRS